MIGKSPAQLPAQGEPGYVLTGSQRVYVTSLMELAEEFKASMVQHFASEAEAADFAGQAEAERVTILFSLLVLFLVFIFQDDLLC